MRCLIRIFSLAKVILIDGMRRHALIGLLLFALAGEAAGLLFFDFIPRDIGRASNDFLFSISWVTGFIFLLFHAVTVAVWDDKRHVIHTYLARPLSRTEYVLGLFAGLSILLLLLNVILSAIGWLILVNIKNSVDPEYFQYLVPFNYILTSLGLFGIEISILAVILLLSGAIRGSFPVLLLTLSYYFICNGLPIVREALTIKGAIPSLQKLNVFLKWMTAVFPDFSRLDFKKLVTVGQQQPTFTELISVFGTAIIYVTIVLWLASLVYQRRDLK